MAIKRHIKNPLLKKAKKGFQGYPIATVAYYGPDNKTATKVAVGIIVDQAAEAEYLERWFLEQGNVRTNSSINDQIYNLSGNILLGALLLQTGLLAVPMKKERIIPMAKFVLNALTGLTAIGGQVRL